MESITKGKRSVLVGVERHDVIQAGRHVTGTHDKSITHSPGLLHSLRNSRWVVGSVQDYTEQKKYRRR